MCLSAIRALQPHLRQSENRLIPTSQVEHRELAELERKLMDYLDFEAELLPTFAPKYLEYDVACGGAVDYAGHKLLGTADRIDVDGEGRCAIIDYKGSISGSYALGVREEGAWARCRRSSTRRWFAVRWAWSRWARCTCATAAQDDFGRLRRARDRERPPAEHAP